MKKLFIILAFFSIINAAQIKRAYATTPQLSVLLELLAPDKMIGLTYKPYAEDKPFMSPNIVNLPVFGGYMQGKEPNLEKLLAAKPQIVFFRENTPKNILEKYQKFGIITKEYSSFKFKDLSTTIKQMSEALGVQKRGDKLIAFLEKTQKIMAKEKIKKPLSVYFAQGNDGLQSECGYQNEKERMKASRDDLAFLLHARNVIICEPFAKSRVQVNYEKLLRLNPDVIFVREVALYKKLHSKDKGMLGRLKAVQNGRFYLAPSSPSNWLQRPPSAMRILGLPWGFSKLYPKLLNENELKKLIMEFYANFAVSLDASSYQALLNDK